MLWWSELIFQDSFVCILIEHQWSMAGQCGPMPEVICIDFRSSTIVHETRSVLVSWGFRNVGLIFYLYFLLTFILFKVLFADGFKQSMVVRSLRQKQYSLSPDLLLLSFLGGNFTQHLKHFPSPDNYIYIYIYVCVCVFVCVYIYIVCFLWFNNVTQYSSNISELRMNE